MKKWIIGYSLNSENNGLISTQLMALKEFGETAKYTDDEANVVLKLIHSKTVPKFEKIYFWGDKTYEEWNNFRDELNKEINALFL